MTRAARYLTLLVPVAAVLAMSKVHAAWVSDPPYDYTGSFRFAWSIAYAVTLAVAAYGFGLPELPRRVGQATTAAVGGAVASAAVVSMVQLVVGDALLPRFVVFGVALLIVPAQVALWALARQGRSRHEDRDRVAVVGSAEEADRLVADLRLAPERAAAVVVALRPAEAAGLDGRGSPTENVGDLESGAARAGEAAETPVVAGGDAAAGGRALSHRPLVEAVARERCTVLVLDRSALTDHSILVQAAALHEAGVRVRSLVEFYEGWLGKLPISELERSSLFFDIAEVHRVRYGRLKRLIDVCFGVLGLIPLLLVTPLVVVGDLVANRGSLLYRQPRVGRGGEVFDILKFRSMTGGGRGEGGAWTAVDDPRVTPFGRFLRKSHLDELPQMVNILRGDLSVVGPRPEQPHYVSELSGTLPFYGMRHLVRPGLTGWAQVKYGYAGDERDAVEKLQYEFFYLRHQGLRFDLRVIGRTVRSVMGSEGAGR